MSFLKYIRDHAVWLLIALFLVVTIDIYLFTIDRSAALMVYVACSVFFGVLLGMFIDYRRVKKFLGSMEKNMEGLDQRYLLPEILENGDSEEERLFLFIMKQMENSMTDNVNDYKRKNEEYRSYIETWVHEVKIPIATAGLIAENHKNDSIRETGIENEIKRIQNYVEQALYYARSEAVEKDYFIKEIDLTDAVNTVIADKRTALREKRAQINIHDTEPQGKVFSDGKWIGFVIGQIVDNSIKYAKPGEAPSIEIFATEDEKGTTLHIKDFGIGMKSGEVSRVCEKGFTGTNGRINGTSTGMGLYLCDKLCKRMEHELSISSVEGEYTDVSICFGQK